MLSGDYAVLKEDANAAAASRRRRRRRRQRQRVGRGPPRRRAVLRLRLLDDGALVRPQMFKTVVGRGHAEFSSGRQQDAPEYLQHLLEVVLRAERSAQDRVSGGGNRRPPLPACLPSASKSGSSAPPPRPCAT